MGGDTLHEDIGMQEILTTINGAEAYIVLPDSYDAGTTYPVLMAIHGSGREARSYDDSDPLGLAFYAKQRDLALANGYLFCVISNGPDSWGTDAGLTRLNALYDYMRVNYNTSSQFALWSTSAGGVLMHRMVKDYPSRVLGCLGMFPVYDLDIEWPILQSCRDAWGTQAAYAGKNPPSFTASLTTKRYRIDHGDADTSVPLAGNSQALATTVNGLGGSVTLNVIVGGIHDTNIAYYNDSAINTFLQSIIIPTLATPTLTRDGTDVRLDCDITQMIEGDIKAAYYRDSDTVTTDKPDTVGQSVWFDMDDSLAQDGDTFTALEANSLMPHYIVAIAGVERDGTWYWSEESEPILANRLIMLYSHIREDNTLKVPVVRSLRTIAECSVFSPGGIVNFTGEHSDKFDLSLDSENWYSEIEISEGMQTFYLGMTPGEQDTNVNVRLRIPR